MNIFGKSKAELYKIGDIVQLKYEFVASSKNFMSNAIVEIKSIKRDYTGYPFYSLENGDSFMWYDRDIVGKSNSKKPTEEGRKPTVDGSWYV